MKFGVVRFPGSLRRGRRPAGLPALRRRRAALARRRDLRGVDAVVVPGGFSYGDYLRVGAIARFSPVMDAVREFARAGGPVLGICNGFQVLCEAGLLPGALLPNESLRFVCRQVDVEVENPTRPSRASARGATAVDPGQAHHRPLLRADVTLEQSRPTARSCCATHARQNPNGSAPTSPASATRGQRDGPDAASRARRRPADGLARRRALFESLAHVPGSRHRREHARGPPRSSASPTPSTR